MVVKIWIEMHPYISGMSAQFDMGNETVLQCVQRQGVVSRDHLLSLSEEIFAISSLQNISLLAKYVSSRENEWVDALSKFQGTSVK